VTWQLFAEDRRSFWHTTPPWHPTVGAVGWCICCTLLGVVAPPA
jgi:hypothetical protein